MEKLVYYCQGESHKATNKVCQDYTKCIISDGVSIAVLSDGHGGNRYFRSDVGSKCAVDCTIEKVRLFVDNISDSVFQDKPFTAVSALTTERKQENLRKNFDADKQLNRLFASILYSWRARVEQHAEENPFTEEELKLINNPDDPHSIDKTYGCTLMCFVRAKTYWFAFHLGDGKCFSFNGAGLWREPIPWDERCFLNKTTSICDNDALSEFRYCYEGDGEFPVAVFLASDGLDDSFGEAANQANFYIQILKLVDKSSNDDAQKEIEDSLPQLSKIESRDDMSIACLYDETVLHSIVSKLIGWQRHNVQIQIDAVNSKIKSLKEKQLQYEPFRRYTEKELIDAQYTKIELERQFAEKKKLADKYDRFSKEIDEHSFTAYSDDIGLYEFKEETDRSILTTEQIKKKLRVMHHPIYIYGCGD